ncbi:MAG: hypothetical protein J0I06_26215 [Planctomycetes bacterium]|nr:hypothetical protein [Planctomycetota bacterium]
MSAPKHVKQIEDLTKRVQELEKIVELQKAATELRLKSVEDQLKERSRVEDELRGKVSDLTAKNAALEERSRHQEKTSDRGWTVGQAAIVTLVAALLSFLAQSLSKK